MRKIILAIALFCSTILFAQNTVVGKWKTIDDETGKPKSIVEIYEKSGKYYGKIIDILNPESKHRVCENCTGEDKNKPILGMIIIKGLVKDGDDFNGGRIIDPKNGKSYKCNINLEDKDKLKVRGYIGFSLIGRSQYWIRIK
jgi:uncharacterized protein (DUF2147 family)